MEHGSEFGGVSGLIQPLPHELTAAEEARLMRKMNPVDPNATVEKERLAERDGDISNPDGFGG